MPDAAAIHDAQMTYLRALTRFSATPPVDRVPRLLRLDDATAAGVLSHLIDAGLVEVWGQGAPGDRPRAVLTCLGAERLGVKLTEAQGSIVGARWGRHGDDPGPPESEAVKTVSATDYASGDTVSGVNVLNRYADPASIDPALAVEWAEQAERPAVRVNVLRRIKNHHDGVPRPWIFLGLRPAWPVRWAREQGEPCPGCQGRPLTFARACLVCDRTGVDALLDSPPRPKARGKAAPGRAKARGKAAEPEAVVVESTAAGLAGGTGPVVPVPKPVATKAGPRPKAKRKRKRVAFRPSEKNSFDLKALRGKAG